LRDRILGSTDPGHDDDLAAWIEREGFAASVGPKDHKVVQVVQRRIEVGSAPDFNGWCEDAYGTLRSIVGAQKCEEVLRYLRTELLA
jgi:hypothetical protein